MVYSTIPYLVLYMVPCFLVTSSLIKETIENESNEVYNFGQETYNIVFVHGYFFRLIFQYACFNNARSLHFFLVCRMIYISIYYPPSYLLFIKKLGSVSNQFGYIMNSKMDPISSEYYYVIKMTYAFGGRPHSVYSKTHVVNLSTLKLGNSYVFVI
jgi:fucose 4-O-acetylase-like acetyltransferase